MNCSAAESHPTLGTFFSTDALLLFHAACTFDAMVSRYRLQRLNPVS